MDIKTIKEVVSHETQIDLDNPMITKSRQANYVNARMLYYKLCRDFLGMPYQKIGNSLRPSKNHATVLHSIKSFNDWQEHDRVLRQQYVNVQAKIQYIMDLSEKDDMDLTQALTRLHDLESRCDELLRDNKILANQLKQCHDKNKRQN